MWRVAVTTRECAQLCRVRGTNKTNRDRPISRFAATRTITNANNFLPLRGWFNSKNATRAGSFFRSFMTTQAECPILNPFTEKVEIQYVKNKTTKSTKSAEMLRKLPEENPPKCS